MFGIAYRMLGSATEAEDVLQDAWLRWQATDTDAVREPGAFLATMVTRLCLTALDSARARREVYVGPWLPEPIPTGGDDPANAVEHAESLYARRAAAARAPQPDRARRLRAPRGVRLPVPPGRRGAGDLGGERPAARKPRQAAPRRGARRRRRAPAERERLLAAFMAAAEAGDVGALEDLLAADAMSVSDGGGKVLAARKEVHGRERVAQFVLGVLDKFGEGIVPVPVEFNGEVGDRRRDSDGEVMAVWTADVTTEGIRRLLIVLNPDKLERITLSHS